MTCGGQGHINPMIQFSKRLQSKGVKITIAPTKSFLKTMKELPTPVSIEAISDGYDDGGVDEAGSYAVYITRFKEVGLDTLSQLIQKLKNCGCPVNCIVYDPFLPWAVEVAKKFGLVSAAFFTQNCTVDNIYYYVDKGVIKLPPTKVDEEILLPGLSCTIETSDVPSFVSTPESDILVEMLVNQFSNLQKADWILINSFYELEKEPTNTKLVQDVWEMGIKAKQDEKGIVRREVIEECIKLVMEEEKGNVIRGNAKKWKELARNAMDEGGSSDKNIEEFVSKLMTIS
ncbi:hypothetical protein RND71_032272 [Anisodus tanguticus]|uniref:Uncharacterized protein n=1 Tax=Anisodus tanguticus TaxID=243964 RepID=A0AAE1RF44_9SOLA|nr:hypothetical protein RND71_032272 [Anisodus tanguticus]